jgi:hypothetical protein
MGSGEATIRVRRRLDLIALQGALNHHLLTSFCPRLH